MVDKKEEEKTFRETDLLDVCDTTEMPSTNWDSRATAAAACC